MQKKGDIFTWKNIVLNTFSEAQKSYCRIIWTLQYFNLKYTHVYLCVCVNAQKQAEKVNESNHMQIMDVILREGSPVGFRAGGAWSSKGISIYVYI